MFAALGRLGGLIRPVLLTGCILLLGTRWSAADTTVTVTKKAPLESLTADGSISGVSEAKVGTLYSLVSSSGGQLIVKDAQGVRYQIALAATDYVAPVVAVTNALAQAVPPTATTNTVTPATPATNAVPLRPINPTPSVVTETPSNNSTLDFASINKALGKPIFSALPLWQEPALLLAQRLGLGLEGHTKWESSYRRYLSGQPSDPKATMLGVGAYCMAIYADADDHPTSLLVAFANDGDFRGIGQLATDLYHLEFSAPGETSQDTEKREREESNKLVEIRSTFETTRKDEQETLIQNLTKLLGEPKQTVFGSDQVTKENTLRWDWNGASFLLTCQVNRYDLLRIVPTELADNDGRTERIPRDDIGKKLSEAVEHRPTGDVVITQIPMADQGPKGYCVPATWERVLRYEGVPGDMYTLSRIGNGVFGGGEWGGNLAKQLDATLNDYGRHCDVLHPTKLDYIAIRHYIDDGVPIFWGVNVHGYEPALQRYSLCDRNKDWDEWKKLLDQTRSAENSQKPSPLPGIQGHQVLITGYNPETKELAWSDPWGRATQERWMTEEEAQRCSLNDYYIITW